MPLEKILVEYAKLHLQLVQANEQIALLQAQVKSMQQAPQMPPEDAK